MGFHISHLDFVLSKIILGAGEMAHQLSVALTEDLSVVPSTYIRQLTTPIISAPGKPENVCECAHTHAQAHACACIRMLATE